MKLTMQPGGVVLVEVKTVDGRLEVYRYDPVTGEWEVVK